VVELTLRNRLLAHRSALVEAWFQGIARTSFSPRPLAEVRARLDQLFGDTVEVLVSEPFEAASARSVGVALADLHYLNATAAAATVRTLGHHLTLDLLPDDIVMLQPRLVDVLAEIVGGFYAASRDAILQEQDEMRSALFVTRQQAEAANEARLLAETTVRARSELLGHVAHDLRSPLTSIKGQADLLAHRLQRDLPTADWLHARVKSISASADRMQGMISELLDAARLEAGEELELRLRRVAIQQLVREVVQRELGGRAVWLDFVEDPVYATVDIARFERVLQNLLSNAVKFSPPEGSIEVHVRGGDSTVLLEVRDYGMGIPAEELPRITTPFYRASTAGGVPGTGLGLAGVKAIVEQHRGTLVINSVEGEGTSVLIRLPI
jgi:signal transduction histidine kinase